MKGDTHSSDMVILGGWQGDDPDVTWTFLVIGYWFKLLFGILGLVGSLLWILQTVLYVMISPPVSGFLNDLFIQLSGGAFGQFVAIILFGAFSLYLLLCTMAGSFKLGVTFLWFSVSPHPHQPSNLKLALLQVSKL
jgi:LMBR1 domain-containing protein 1